MSVVDFGNVKGGIQQFNQPTEIRETVSLGRKSKHSLNESEMEVDVKDDLRSVRSSRVSMASTFRPKGETCEERRMRKQAIKEERRERRQEKKANKLAFREQRKAINAEKSAIGGGKIKIRPIN
uniref:Protein LTV1 homolog n=1 Tax=Meloidogyne hapla TaxID=6305 RepID=A0A1I8BIS8_MELHA